MSLKGQDQKGKRASGRRPRGSLSRDEIVAGAFELAAEGEGIDGLSMPRLARHLGVGVTSLYWYFRSKDDLLTALTQEAAGRLYTLLPDYRAYPWDEHLLRYFRDFRRVFREQPVLCDLIVLRAPMQARSPEAVHQFFALLEREIAPLVEAGFAVRDAVNAYATLSVYTRGCVLNERLFTAAEELLSSGGYPAPSPDIDPENLPVMAQATPYWTASMAGDENFEAGIGFIIDGLRAHLARQGKATRPRRRAAAR
jgi:AcrR family transcriptional regulator